jgi:predicted nucleic acid-binding protein
MKTVVVDANIAFRSLTSKRGYLGSAHQPPAHIRFIAPRFVFVELFKHKERLVRATEHSEEDLLIALNTVMSRLEFTDESAIPLGIWVEASRLCAPTDPKDIPYVALALFHNADLWTKDEELKAGLRKREFDRFYQP